MIESGSTPSNFKPSKYNFFVKYDDESYYGYNFLYRSIVRVPVHAYAAVKQLISEETISKEPDEHKASQRSQISTQSFQALHEAHFIVDRNIDEMNLIRFKYFRNLFANDLLSLVVLPTLQCNFCCPYCFEFKKPISMNHDVQNALIRWVEKTFKNTRHIHVAWFGGEPLLEKKTIFSLSKRFQLFCSGVGSSYSASLVTNGFLLDSHFQKSLSSLRIKNIQITLDGDKEAHDKSRRLKNGKGSYDRIYENILSFCTNIKDCNLTLRINCGDDNYEGIEKLLAEFPVSVRDRVNVYFRWIFANEATRYQEFSRTARGTAPYEGLSRLYIAAMTLGWRTKNPLSQFKDGYCDVDKLNHFQIDPEGNVFLCSHTYRASEAIGSVLYDRGIVGSDAYNRYISWYAANPFEDKKCIECILLPACFGGCRKYRVDGNPLCTEESKSIELYVNNLIQSSVKSKPLYSNSHTNY
jgi:uncharacterized protein